MQSAIFIFLILSFTFSTLIVLMAVVGAARGRQLARYNIERELGDCPESERPEISEPLIPDTKPSEPLTTPSSSQNRELPPFKTPEI